MVSSSATFSTTSPDHQVCSWGMYCPTTMEAATHSSVSTRVEGRPELPLGSRSVRASGGRAGTMAGLKMASTTMNSA